jgi:hypothetical protein
MRLKKVRDLFMAGSLHIESLNFGFDVAQSHANHQHTDGLSAIDDRRGDLYRLGPRALIEFNFTDEHFTLGIVERCRPLRFITLPVITGRRVGGDVGTLIIAEERLVERPETCHGVFDKAPRLAALQRLLEGRQTLARPPLVIASLDFIQR